MKKALSALLILFSVAASAQQDPYYTHFKDVMQAYNPAAAGHQWGEICISGLTHHQWRDYGDDTKARGTDATEDVGLTNVAPVTYNLNVNSVFKVGKGDDKFIGAGLTIIDDQIGFTASTGFMANLNFRKKLQGGFSEISGGLGLGSRQWGWENPNFKAKDPGDPNVPLTSASESEFNLNLGLQYKVASLASGKIKNLYAGFSVTNLNSPLYKIPAGLAGSIILRQYVPHYYTVVGADMPMGNFVLEPAILAKYGLLNGAYKPQIDLSATALFSNTFRGGIAYRQWGNSDALSILLGYQRDKIKIGYSYDITLSNIQRVSNGTHEIFVKYCIPITVSEPGNFFRESVRFL